MGIAKDRLFADAADFANADKVISILAAADGTPFGQIDVGGVKTLPVSFAAIPTVNANINSKTLVKDSKVTVGLTAVALPAVPVANRMSVTVQNNSNKPMYLGASGVTVATGIKLSPGSVWEENFQGAIYAISDTAGLEARVLEFA